MPIHTIPPVFDENSKILILGSFPSVKSREADFFYGHPKNRFWCVVSAVLSHPEPHSVTEKKAMLLNNGIALWDVVASCDISGSSDSAIKNVVPNDIRVITDVADIKKIYLNGGTASRLFYKYISPDIKIEAVTLPSTSPANARFSLEMLECEWGIIKEYI